jgi:sphingolipid delta-4 desaturase
MLNSSFCWIRSLLFSQGKIIITKDSSWTVFLLTVYFVGGTINHTMHVLIHDFTHWAGHPNMYVNKFFAILCNVPMGLPSAISFGKYHNDHHNYLGE